MVIAMRLSILAISFLLVTSPLWGKIVFYSKRDGNAQIYTMNSDGSHQTWLTFNEAGDGWPTWSPNGQQIAFNSNRDGNWEVYVMDADGSNQRRLTHHPALDAYPHWHPDGTRIAFRSGRDGADITSIYTMDLDGNDLRLVTQAEFIAKLRWSPDGERIAFEGVIGGNREVFVIDADGTNRWQVSKTVSRSTMRLGGWSPDGKKILYTVITKPLADGVAFEYSMVIATLHLSNREVIKFEPVVLPPSRLLAADGHGWGADGKSIIITGKIGNWDIYRFRLDTHELIQLTDSPATDFAPHEWDPRLPVPPQQGKILLYWGEIKSSLLWPVGAASP